MEISDTGTVAQLDDLSHRHGTWFHMVMSSSLVRARASALGGICRIVVAKPGLDGHDRGAKIVARALRDAGLEAIYTGLHQTPEQVVATAIQEDAHAIGLSILSGAHLTLFADVLAQLRARGADDVVVFGGGIIPPQDVRALHDMGVGAIFTPGARIEDIVAWIRDNVPSG